MANKYRSFLNTLFNEDSNLSGVISRDSNGFYVRWGLNGRYYTFSASMSFEQAMQVYKSDYWPPGLELLKSQIMANLVFDFGFNHGRTSAVKLFQKWLGVEQDGVVGPLTAAAANKLRSAYDLRSLANAIKAEYEAIGGPDLDAWQARVERNLESAAY